ncbi:DUF6503 family protein [Roseivirga sp. BDSF3-8]|uniref:DUF6503 family protein n=1 Tax=Roseivirga sp. BDSF3-8 TaxID=3241598 RepID=UPI0035321A48
MHRFILFLALLIISFCLFMRCNGAGQESKKEAEVVNELLSPAGSLLQKTLAFHDPGNRWPAYTATITQQSRRLNQADTSEVRTRQVSLDSSLGSFSMESDAGGYTLRRVVMEDSLCLSEWDRPGISAEDSTAMSLTCEGAENYRNYFRYLIGLPMVLQDSATVLSEETGTEELFGETYQTLRVNYLPEGEHPEWTFFIDTVDYHLAAARFVKPDRTGEYIVFGDMEEHRGIKHFGSFMWHYLDKKPLAREQYSFR